MIAMRTAHLICILIVFICIASAGCASKEHTVAATTPTNVVPLQNNMISKVIINPSIASGTVGSTLDFTAKAYGFNGEEVPTTITWSVGSGSGSITDGVLRPTGSGEIIVMAVAGNVAGMAKVKH